MRPSRHRWPVAALASLVLVTACATDPYDDASSTATTTTTTTTPADAASTIRVPEDLPTIQAAVDEAKPGTLILISAGVYRETVTVETPRLVIRGLDRNRVIIDGEDSRENGIKVFSDGVAIENLTLRAHKGNGALFTGDYQSGNPLNGFRISYVTAYNNGLYGLYAFGATNGLIEHTYTSGHPDAGIYVGQCFPCNTVVIDAVAERNAAGFQGANAGGELLVTRSVFRGNRVGIESVSTTKERLAPQRDAQFVANLVESNNGDGAPKAIDTFGVGIAVGGGRTNRIRRNVVTSNITAGIVISEKESFLPEGNRVEANEVTGNGVDLAYAVGSGALLGNCFDDNTFQTASPADLADALACAPEAQGGAGVIRLGAAPPDVDYRTVPAPPDQPQMPDAATTPAIVATDPVPDIDVDSIEAPARG